MKTKLKCRRSAVFRLGWPIVLAAALLLAPMASATITYSSADGTVPGLPAPGAASRMVFGDFNNDHRVDVFYQTGGNGTAWGFASGNANGTFTTTTTAGLPGTPFSGVTQFDFTGTGAVLYAGDFNGDGLTDIWFTFNGNAGTILWNSAGGFTSAAASTYNFPAAGAASRVAVGDFDNDGITDILYQTGANGTAWGFAKGNSNGTFTVNTTAGLPGTPFSGVTQFDFTGTGSILRVGDFNGDRRSDIWWHANSDDGTILWNGAGGFTSAAGATYNFPAVAAASRLGVGDFNSDGIDDLLYQTGANGTAWAYAQGSATGTFTVYTSTNATGVFANGTTTPFNGVTQFDFTGTGTVLVRGDVSGDTDDDIWFVFNGDNGILLTQDNSPPLLSSSTPADGAVNVLLNANISLTFSESVTKGTGNFYIVRVSDDVVIETIAVTSAQVSGSGTTWTIDPSVTLGINTHYALKADPGVFKDADLAIFMGISDKTTLDFTSINNVTPSFSAGATNTLTVNEDASATSIDSLLGVVDTDSSQTLTWSVSSSPSKGTLNGFNKTAGTAGNATPITPSGLTYTPSANQNGSDSFVVQVSDSFATDTITVNVTITPIADTPSVTNATTNEDTQTTTGLVISRNAADGTEVTHFKITSITGGTLFQNNGTTQINNGDFITFAQGNAGLKFTPATNAFGTSFSFVVQAATSNAGAGLSAGTATATITVTAIGDAPQVTNATTNEDTQTTSGLVLSRNAVDSTEVTHFKITSITGGTLFQNDGTTAISNNDVITFAQGNAGLKFTPTANANTAAGGTFSFVAQSATSAGGAGVGATTTATITVTAIADTPSVTNSTTNEDTQTTTGLVISRNAADSTEVTHFKITAITGGTLFLNDGTTQISDGDFITFAQGNAGLKFTPAANTFGSSFSFGVQGATSNAGAGLSSGTATATITVTAIGDAPQVTNATTNEDTQTASGLVLSRNAVDGNEVTHFKITAITGGTLFQNNGTTQINNNDVITFAQGNAGLKFTPTLNANTAAGGTFSFAAQSATSAGGAGVGATTTATITVNAVNDDPSASGLPATVTVAEDTLSNFDISAVTLTDVDAGGGSLTLILTASGGTFTSSTGGGVTVTGSGTGTLQLDGTLAALNTFLDTASNVKYTGALNVSGTAAATVAVTINDNGNTGIGGGDPVALGTINVDITAVNDAPAFANLNGTPSFTEGGSAVTLDTDVTVTDLELATAGAYTGASLTIARNGGQNANDSFSFDTSGALFTVAAGNLQAGGQTFATFTNTGGTLTVTFTSSGTNATQALVNNVLQRIQYTNTSDNPPATAQLSWTFSDGNSGGQGTGGALSATGSTTVSITGVNDNPQVAGLPAARSFNEDVSGNFDLSGTTVTDPDSANVTVTLTASAGTFVYAGDGNVPAASLTGITTSTMTISGLPSTVNGYLAVGTNITYVPAANSVAAATVTVSVNDHDGSGDITVGTINVNLTSVNDAPAGTDHTATTNEDTGYTFATSDFGFTDPNDTPANALLAVKITTLPGAGTLTNNGGAVSAGNSIPVADITGNKLVFTPAANAHGTGYASFTFQVQDDGGTTNSGIDLDATPNTMTIDVTSVNDAPAGTNKTITTPEDTGYVFAAADFGFTDPNDTPANTLLAVKITTLPALGTLKDNNVAVSAGGFVPVADITGGKLVFTPGADGNGTGYTTFTFQVQDNGGTSNGGVDLDASANTITFDVTPTAETPNVTAATTNEDTQTTSGLVLSRGAGDGNEVTHFKITAITGGTLFLNDGTTTIANNAFITFAQGNAGLKFTPSLNLNTANGDTFSFVVQAGTDNSGGGLSATGATATITVNAVNDAPVVTASGGTTAYTEGNNTTTTIAVDGGVTVADVDNATLASATVTITTNHQAGQDVLAFTNDGSTMGNIAVSGSFDDTTGALALTSSGATATKAQWQAALRAVTYSNSSNSPNTTNRTIEFKVNDGAADSAVSPKTLSVTAVNDSPVIATSGGTTAFTEANNATSTPVVVDGGVTVSDLDSATLASATVTITGNLAAAEDVLAFTNDGSTMADIAGAYTAGTGTLALTSAGTPTKAQWQAALRAVTYTNSSNSPGTATRTVSFVVNDGNSASAAGTQNVSVTATNDTPTDIALSAATINQSAGVNAVVGTLSATDLDDSTFTFTLVAGTGATNNGLFNISGTNLRANDAGAIPGGTYSVRVQADDGHTAGTFAKAFTITVVDDLAPAAPSVPDLIAASDSGASNTDNITNVTTPTFSGTAEANSIVQVFRAGAVSLGTTTASGAGAWTLTSGALAAGTHSITAKATDAATNTSVASAALSLTIDTTAPTLATILRQNPATVNTSAASTTWRVTFAEDVTGVDASDFALTVVSGTPTATIGTVTPVNASVYDVAVGSIVGQGLMRLDLKASGTGIADLAGNALAAGGFTTGDFYSVGVTNVFDTVALATGTTRSVSGATTNKVAQRFSTAAAAPLSLTTVIAALGTVTGTPAPVVTIHADNAGAINPTVITTLTNPASLTANKLNVWTSTTLLTASTTYWVVFEDTSAIGAYDIKETAATSGGVGNWLNSPADYFYRYGANAATGPQAGALQIAIGATSTPSITSPLIASAGYGAAFTYTITATNLPSSFAATGLPAGLSLTANTGLISGTPTGAGTFNVALTGTNGSGVGAPSTLVLTVGPAPVTVTAQPQTRVFGAANPTLTLSYTGFLLGDSVATLSQVPVAQTDATAASAPGNYAITFASGAAASNYSFVYVPGVLTVTKATATVTLSDLAQAFTGSPHPVTVTTNPTGKTVVVTYDGSTSAPSAIGSYAVVATVNDPNYQGSASGTLTIGKTPVMIALAGLSATYDGQAKAVTATTTPSGLPVTITYNGSATAPTTAGSYAVVATVETASQSGMASGTLTIAKAGQTITFGSLADRDTGAPAFPLAATASSGLPISFAVSGPVILNGNSLTLTRVAGAVTVTASQGGDANYFAAADVVQSFTVIAAGPQIFIGDIVNTGGTTKQGDVGALLPPAGNEGTLLIAAPNVNVDLALDFTLQPDGTFVKIITIDDAQLLDAGTPSLAAASRTLTLRGQLVGNLLSGRFDEVALSFAIPVQAAGPRSSVAGYYPCSVLNSSSGTVHAIVGKGGEVLIVPVLAENLPGVRVTLAADGTFQSDGPTQSIRGSVNAATATMSGVISRPGKPDVFFVGLASIALRTDRVINLSSRARIGPAGERTLITGFVIGGGQPKRVLLRAIGPALSGYGVTGVLSNPKLQLFDSNQKLIYENDDWSGTDTSTAFAQTGAFSLPAGSRDAALVVTLAPGAYTMHIIDGGEIGVAMAEIYDASANPAGEYQRLINISSRGTVEAGDGTLIGGFVVTGNSPKRVLVRGVGPTLANYGVTTPLTDPKLTLFSGQTAIAQNDNWETPTAISANQVPGTAADVTAAGNATGAFKLPTGSKDAAIVITLAPGAYTAQVASGTGQTGVALVEIYEIPE